MLTYMWVIRVSVIIVVQLKILQLFISFCFFLSNFMGSVFALFLILSFMVVYEIVHIDASIPIQETACTSMQRQTKKYCQQILYIFWNRLYLSTSMANPHYLPAVYNKVNIINFTVTFDGLQEQLLSAVVSQVGCVKHLWHLGNFNMYM